MATSHCNRSARGTNGCHRSQAPPRPRSEAQGEGLRKPRRSCKTQSQPRARQENATTRPEANVTERLSEVEQQKSRRSPSRRHRRHSMQTAHDVRGTAAHRAWASERAPCTTASPNAPQTRRYHPSRPTPASPAIRKPERPKPSARAKRLGPRQGMRDHQHRRRRRLKGNGVAHNAARDADHHAAVADNADHDADADDNAARPNRAIADKPGPTAPMIPASDVDP